MRDNAGPPPRPPRAPLPGVQSQIPPAWSCDDAIDSSRGGVGSAVHRRRRQRTGNPERGRGRQGRSRRARRDDAYRRAERLGGYRAARPDRLREGVRKGAARSRAAGKRGHALCCRVHQQAVHGRLHPAAARGRQAERRGSRWQVLPGADPLRRGHHPEHPLAHVGLPRLRAAGLHHPGVDQADDGREHRPRMGDAAARFRAGHAVSGTAIRTSTSRGSSSRR